jgi:hypothetical protein
MSQFLTIGSLDNLFDHEQLIFSIILMVRLYATPLNFYTLLSCVKASDSNISYFQLALSTHLRHIIELPVDTLLCSDMHSLSLTAKISHVRRKTHETRVKTCFKHVHVLTRLRQFA